MSVFADRLERIDHDVEKKASGFQNLEATALSAVVDYMVYSYHMHNRTLSTIPLKDNFATDVLRLRERMAVYEELGHLASELIKAKRAPEPGINGPQEDDE